MGAVVLLGLGFVLLFAVATGNGKRVWEAILNNKVTPHYDNPNITGGGSFGGNSTGGDGVPVPKLPPVPVPPVGDSLSVVGPPSLTATQMDHILAAAHSPATGIGATLISLGQQYNLDPAVALAFFAHETSLGTNYGNLNAGSNSWGNIRCTAGWTQGGGACTPGGFRAYPTFAAGAADWFHLISTVYVAQGHTTVDTILPIYAPSFENNTTGYIAQVKRLVAGWRGH